MKKLIIVCMYCLAMFAFSTLLSVYFFSEGNYITGTLFASISFIVLAVTPAWLDVVRNN